MNTAPDGGHRGLSEPAAATALLVLAMACAGLLFAQERAVLPVELPSLTLPADAVRAVTARDRALAALRPAPAVLAIEGLFAAQGEAEAKALGDLAPYRERLDALRNLCAALAAKGEAGPDTLRARGVERLEAALDLRLPDVDVPGVLGAFARTLEREGVTRDGEIVAPMFIVRTLYKARGNLLCGFAPDAGFERIERRAYFGWEALHAERLPPARRLAALDRYREAGGGHVDEARGALLFRGGDVAGAEATFARAFRREGSIRLRNDLIGARRAGGLPHP